MRILRFILALLFLPLFPNEAKAQTEIQREDYIFDPTANELVREDFNIEGKTSILCRFLSPLWDTRGTDNTKARLNWNIWLAPYQDLKGIKELRAAIKHGQYPELYKIVKNLPEETKQKAIRENPNLAERDIKWLSEDWGVL